METNFRVQIARGFNWLFFRRVHVCLLISSDWFQFWWQRKRIYSAVRSNVVSILSRLRMDRWRDKFVYVWWTFSSVWRILCTISSTNTFQFTQISTLICLFFCFVVLILLFHLIHRTSEQDVWCKRERARERKNLNHQHRNANDDLNCENIDLKYLTIDSKQKFGDAKYFLIIYYRRSSHTCTRSSIMPCNNNSLLVFACNSIFDTCKFTNFSIT